MMTGRNAIQLDSNHSVERRGVLCAAPWPCLPFSLAILATYSFHSYGTWSCSRRPRRKFAKPPPREDPSSEACLLPSSWVRACFVFAFPFPIAYFRFARPFLVPSLFLHFPFNTTASSCPLVRAAPPLLFLPFPFPFVLFPLLPVHTFSSSPSLFSDLTQKSRTGPC
jgi:hypothetical protein